MRRHPVTAAPFNNIVSYVGRNSTLLLCAADVRCLLIDNFDGQIVSVIVWVFMVYDLEGNQINLISNKMDYGGKLAL